MVSFRNLSLICKAHSFGIGDMTYKESTDNTVSLNVLKIHHDVKVLI
jgi:hypothetical protein